MKIYYNFLLQFFFLDCKNEYQYMNVFTAIKLQNKINLKAFKITDKTWNKHGTFYFFNISGVSGVKDIHRHLHQKCRWFWTFQAVLCASPVQSVAPPCGSCGLSAMGCIGWKEGPDIHDALHAISSSSPNKKMQTWELDIRHYSIFTFLWLSLSNCIYFTRGFRC